VTARAGPDQAGALNGKAGGPSDLWHQPAALARPAIRGPGISELSVCRWSNCPRSRNRVMTAGMARGDAGPFFHIDSPC
jgi:hypothetical protein